MGSIPNCKFMESVTRDGQAQPRVAQNSIVTRKRELSGNKGKLKQRRLLSAIGIE